MVSEAQAQIVEAMFLKDELSLADRSWLAVRILSGDLPPETVNLIESRWPQMRDQVRSEWRQFYAGVIMLATAGAIAGASISLAFRLVHR